jgi:1-acyl-sn-glycerol-3-phosphate acyltransferase
LEVVEASQPVRGRPRAVGPAVELATSSGWDPRSALRSIYLWSAIALLTSVMYFLGAPLFLVTMPFDPQRRVGHWYATQWGRLILRLNNRWHVEVRGQERIPRDRPLVVISNHQGVGDIMMAFCLDLHFKWISKAANFYVPCMGWFMFHAGYIPLHRGSKSSIMKCMARAKRYLDAGVSVLFFPEGTRSFDGEVGAFKAGAFKLAIEGGFDLLPMAITGTFNALPKHTWKFPEELAHMKLQVGEPISTRGLGEADLPALIERARQTVVELKDELEGQAPVYRPASVPRRKAAAGLSASS